jgi:phosphoglycerate dehydrogenase-like enzyme
MPRVLFINGQRRWVAQVLQDAAPAGFDVSWLPFAAPDDEKAVRIGEVEFLVLHPAKLSPQLMRCGKKLQLIQLLTAGYDQIDLQIAAELGVPVATNGGANSWAVAEHTIALVLALYRRLVSCDRSVREGRWREPVTGFNTYEVAGKVLGLIGAGTIGCKVARRFAGFECGIIYCDGLPARDIEREIGARRVSLDELLREADIVSLHIPATSETTNLINRQTIGMMKPNAVLINTSRGAVVDEGALVEALEGGRILGAGLDVFAEEPIPANHPILALENVVLTPHAAGHTYEGWYRRAHFAWENIRRAAAGEAPRSAVESAL